MYVVVKTLDTSPQGKDLWRVLSIPSAYLHCKRWQHCHQRLPLSFGFSTGERYPVSLLSFVKGQYFGPNITS